MPKPKLIRVPSENANVTPEGTLIKVTDKVFVLVEGARNDSCPFTIFSIGDRVRVKSKITPTLELQEKFIAVPMFGWIGYIHKVKSFGIAGLYQIAWDEETLQAMPDDFKNHCVLLKLDPDEIVIDEDHLELFEEKI